MGRIGGPEILLLALIVLLLFGATRLPKLARSMREARDEFQKGTTEGQQEGAPPPAPESSTQPPASSEASTGPAAEKPQENT